MQIFPDRLVFPRNFRFFNRLPARFEILVVDRGAKTTRGTVFELELVGQRLALPSKAELKVGMRYELEKISATEFRILREVDADKKPAEAEVKGAKRPNEVHPADGAEYLSTHLSAQSTDLLAVRFLSENGSIEKSGESKYAFDLTGEFALRGVFVARSPGKYTLFLSGAAADADAVRHFTDGLRDFGVEAIRQVSAEVLDRIEQGSIDMKS